MVLPADKGRVTVVMNTEEYYQKCEALLSDSKTYKKLKGDPTAKFKRQFVTALKDLKDRKVISWEFHKKLYPTTDQPPRFYGLPKVHKANMPLRPIVSGIGSISYNCSKHLAEVLTCLVGKTDAYVKNSKEFKVKLQLNDI